MRAGNIYAWFKIYEDCIKDSDAKWDLLNHIRKEVPLNPKHEEFYQSHGKRRGFIKCTGTK